MEEGGFVFRMLARRFIASADRVTDARTPISPTICGVKGPLLVEVGGEEEEGECVREFIANDYG